MSDIRKWRTSRKPVVTGSIKYCPIIFLMFTVLDKQRRVLVRGPMVAYLHTFIPFDAERPNLARWCCGYKCDAAAMRLWCVEWELNRTRLAVKSHSRRKCKHSISHLGEGKISGADCHATSTGHRRHHRVWISQPLSNDTCFSNISF